MPGPNTGRAGLPTLLEADTPDVPRDHNALANALDGIIAMDLQGLLAARPAAAIRGRYFWATDVGIMYRDDGAAWTAINPATAQTMLDAPGQVLQEGVMSGGAVTRIDPATVRVSAGSAWIDGDAIAGFGSGRYPVSWPQTDITGIPAEAGVANRVDQIIVQLTGSAFSGTCSIQRLAGASQAGGTTLTGPGSPSPAGRVGAAALPGGSLRLADLLINVNGVQVPPSNNNIDPNGVIRDRRQWAKGAHYTYQAHGIADLTSTNGAWTDIDTANLSPRLEIASGFWELEWDFFLTGTNTDMWLGIDLPGAVNGGGFSWGTAEHPADWAGALTQQAARRHIKLSGQCAPGSYRFNLRWAMNGGTGTIYRGIARPLGFTVCEIAKASNNNGMG
jgi:hypothetical protein